MRPEKTTMVDSVRSRVDGKDFVILTDYQGLDVQKTTELRNRLRTASAGYVVVKNRLLRRVTQDLGMDGLGDRLKGPTAVVSGAGDIVEVAKILKDFIKDHKMPAIKSGYFAHAELKPEDIDELASMPPRIELLARVVGTIAAPLTGLVSVMNQKVCSLLYVLQAVKDKKDNA